MDGTLQFLHGPGAEMVSPVTRSIWDIFWTLFSQIDFGRGDKCLHHGISAFESCHQNHDEGFFLKTSHCRRSYMFKSYACIFVLCSGII